MAEETVNPNDLPELPDRGLDPIRNPMATNNNLVGNLAPQIPRGIPDIIETIFNNAGMFGSSASPAKTKVSNGNQHLIEAFKSGVNQADSWAQDPNAYGKTFSYGAGIYGANFERYYNQPHYKELGFNPLADNDARYNQRYSWWDDFNRMSSQFVPMVTTGVKQMFQSADANAHGMEDAMAKGGSTRGGVGGFVNNLALQFGLTLGIAGELAVENFAIMGLTAATGGLAAPEAVGAAVTRNAMGARKVFQGWEALKSMGDVARGIADVNKARVLHSEAQTGNALKKAWDFLNPLGRTEEYARNLVSGANGFKDMNNFAKTRKAFGAFYRDLREINATVSEAYMEGSMKQNEYSRQLMDEYYNKNGKMASGKDADEISERAKSVGAATSLFNIPAIFVTNKLVLDKLFDGFVAPSLIEKELTQGSMRKLERMKGWKQGDDVYSFAQRTSKDKLTKALFTSEYLPWSKAYIKGNISEGIQETTQDIVSQAAENYDRKRASDPMTAGFYSGVAAVGAATTGQFTAQGFETFLSGMLMGSFMQGVGAVTTSHKWAPKLYNQFRGTDAHKKYEATRQEREDQIITAANTILKDPMGYFDKNVEHAVRVKDLAATMEQTKADGNQKGYQDAKDKLSFEHMYTLARNNKMSMLTEQFNDFNKMSDQELADAFAKPVSKASDIRNKLQDAQQEALEFQNTYDILTEKFPNPFLVKGRKFSEDEETAKVEFIQTQAFEDARKDLIMSHKMFQRTQQRMESLYNDLASKAPVKDAFSSDINSLLTEQGLRDEINVLRGEVQAFDIGNAEQKAEGRKKQKKLDALIEFRDMASNYRSTLAAVKSPKDKKEVTKASKLLHNAYTNYIKEVANVRNDKHLTTEKINDSFVKVRDYFLLDKESDHVVESINTLNDPGELLDYSKRLAEREKVKRANFPEFLRKGIKELDKIYNKNAFLQALYSMKVVMDPDDALNALTLGRFNNVYFYDATTFDEIGADDPRQAKIQAEILSYQAVLGVTPTPSSTTVAPAVAVPVAPVTPTTIPPTVTEERKIANIPGPVYDKMVALFKKKDREAKGFKEKGFLDASMTPEQLKTSAEFQEFIQNSMEFETYLKEYKAAPPAPVAPAQPPAPAAKLPEEPPTPRVRPPGLDKRFDSLYSRTLRVYEADENYYIDEDGTLYLRVSSLKEERDYSGISKSKTKLSQERGTVIDVALRSMMLGQVSSIEDMRALMMSTIEKGDNKGPYSIKFSNNAFKQIYAELVAVTDGFKQQGFTVYSDIPALYGKLNGKDYAGTIDLLLEREGKFYILDLKTSTTDRRGHADNQAADRIQLNAYRELLKQRTGIEVAGLIVYPLTTKHSTNYQEVTTVAPNIVDGNRLMIVPMDKDIYQLKGFKPDTKAPAKKAPEAPEEPPIPSRLKTIDEILDEKIAEAKDWRSYVNLKIELNYILRDAKEKKMYNLNSDKVTEILDSVLRRIALDVNLEDVKVGVAVIYKDDRVMEVVKMTDTRLVLKSESGGIADIPVKEMDKFIKAIYKPGMENMVGAVEAPVEAAPVEPATQATYNEGVVEANAEDANAVIAKQETKAQAFNAFKDQIKKDCL